MANPYEMLGVAQTSSAEEIRKAYRALARRWHPDRIQEGPERMWAEQKMIEINTAYNEALRHSGRQCGACAESEQFADIRKLIEIGQLGAARQALLRVAIRSAEWNYLFGAVLLRLGETEKAAMYFGLAVRQDPESAQYRTAYRSAEAIKTRENSLFYKLGRIFHKSMSAK